MTLELSWGASTITITSMNTSTSTATATTAKDLSKSLWRTFSGSSRSSATQESSNASNNKSNANNHNFIFPASFQQEEILLPSTLAFSAHNPNPHHRHMKTNHRTRQTPQLRV